MKTKASFLAAMLALATATSQAGQQTIVTISGNSDNITVTTGKRNIVFSRHTGMPQGMKPAFWHKLNEGDLPGKATIKGEDFTTRVKQMTAHQTSDGVLVSVNATWEVNDSNRVEGSYHFLITPQGNMEVSYSMTPQVTVKFLPVIGTAIETLPLQWFGLGPEDAYPNKKSAPVLGLYDTRQWSGTRAARWIDTAIGRIILKPSVGDYAFIDRDAADSQWLRIVPHVQGRSEKGRLNDQRYRITSGNTYSGSFLIRYK